MREFNLHVKAIREGQPRPYADSEYEYEIETENCSEFTVKQFCTKVLRPCKQTRAEWNTGDADSYFRGYYEFSKIGENKYRYYKKEPFTD
mgnify:CR=1 FL=1|jgi:hypothetical protein